MHFGIAFRILGSLLMIFSLTMLPPLLVSWIFSDGASQIFVDAFIFTFVVGFFLWLLFRRFRNEMRTKDGFLVTVLFYLALGTFGSIPFLETAGAGLSVIDALFESFSGLTTRFDADNARVHPW